MGDLGGRARGPFGWPAWAWLLALMGLAAMARILARLPGGEDAFLARGYTFYSQVATQFVDGHGFCYGPGDGCAVRTPLYSLFLAGWLAATGHLYPGAIIAQGLMGAATVWAAWRLGLALYGERVGLLAAAATALNPFAVMHDGALQDTVLVGLLMLLSVVLLVLAYQGGHRAAWLGAGIAIGLAILTSTRITLFAPCAVAWAWAVSARGVGRLARAALVAAPILVLAGGWVARNWQVAGAPVLTTELGDALYFGNSPLTFLHYPRESMDLTADEFVRLPAPMQDALEATSGQDVSRARLLQGWAMDWILAHPAQAAAGAARKVWVALSAELSPAHTPVEQWGYRLVFLPVHVFAILAWWRARRASATHALTLLLVAAFVATTAVFYAHTSHKSYLDPVLFVYAAAFVTADLPRRERV